MWQNELNPVRNATRMLWWHTVYLQQCPWTGRSHRVHFYSALFMTFSNKVNWLDSMASSTRKTQVTLSCVIPHHPGPRCTSKRVYRIEMDNFSVGITDVWTSVSLTWLGNAKLAVSWGGGFNHHWIQGTAAWAFKTYMLVVEDCSICCPMKYHLLAGRLCFFNT